VVACDAQVGARRQACQQRQKDGEENGNSHADQQKDMTRLGWRSAPTNIKTLAGLCLKTVKHDPPHRKTASEIQTKSLKIHGF
jgi:hypothetical protein